MCATVNCHSAVAQRAGIDMHDKAAGYNSLVTKGFVMQGSVSGSTIFAWFHVSLGDGVGDRLYAPATPAAVQPSYSLGVGKLRLDLSNAAAPVAVRVRVGVGELRVIVPRGTAVAVNAHATVGDVRVFNQQEDGHNVNVSAGSGAAMTIDASVGAGRIDVVRAQR